jgi:hypothetical protein
LLKKPCNMALELTARGPARSVLAFLTIKGGLLIRRGNSAYRYTP